MPTLSSISGTYGYGRSPQNLPPPGIAIYPAIGTKKFWSFTTDGTFAFDANATAKTGTCYVITPNVGFSVNVKIWGAGGGSGNASVIRSDTFDALNAVNVPYPPALNNYSAGAGGFVTGTIYFQAGQPYTVFAGGAGPDVYLPMTASWWAGGGGAASGILLGNVFTATTALTPVAIAGGGGGVGDRLSDPAAVTPQYGGAGGGDPAGIGSYFLPGYQYSGSTIGKASGNSFGGEGTSGLPATIPNAPPYSGGRGVGNTIGGGGGAEGGYHSNGGKGTISSDQPELKTIAGIYNITPYYDDSTKGSAGNSNNGGRVVMYMNEYNTSNITATGGDVTTVPIPGYELAYKYHTFTSDDTFVVSYANPTDTIDVFVVGGGGGALTTNSGVVASGGGGGVAFKSNLNIKADSYIVNVGTGGAMATSPSTLGGIYGAKKGKPSAFYVNTLAARGFPNSYIKLINSFGGKIKYINSAGDDTDGLTIATGYTSFSSALSKNNSYESLIVFVVLQGTYNESVSGNPLTKQLSTPINDLNRPRIFVCAPNKVTIAWTPDPSTTTTNNYSPMCQLMNPMSAVYGAIFNRSGYKKDTVLPSRLDELAFFGFTNTGVGVDFPAIFRGSLYNCVFRDTTGDWGLFRTTFLDLMAFTIENCTFVTQSNDVPLTTDGSVRRGVSKIVVKNCIFQKSMSFSVPELENTAQNVIIGSKYVVADHPDKGVYAGEFGWGGSITTPARTTPLVTIVGHGGGGGTTHVLLGVAQSAGGSGGGTTQPLSTTPSTQYNKEAGIDYAGYGYPGASISSGMSSSVGSGAGYRGVGNSGGVGIEFPTGSGVYYGAGGSIGTNASINALAPCSVGLGGGSNNGPGLSDLNGTNGIVMVRYIVPGPYTMPTAPIIRNIIAYGGTERVTATYKEHVFTTNGTFEVVNIPSNSYIDIILVGGGGSGAFFGYYSSPGGQILGGGAGGSVIYQRVLTATRNYSVTVGAGAAPNNAGVFDQRNGNTGGTTSFSNIASAAGGGGGYLGGYYDGHQGTLITDGLFSDNTTYYASGGGGRIRLSGAGNTSYGIVYPGGGGLGNSGSGAANTGGGGGVSNNGYGDGAGAGGSGIVIIRYPIY